MGCSLHTIPGYFRAAEDVPGGEAKMHQDAEGEGIDPFLTRIQEVQDKLLAVGVVLQP